LVLRQQPDIKVEVPGSAAAPKINFVPFDQPRFVLPHVNQSVFDHYDACSSETKQTSLIQSPLVANTVGPAVSLAISTSVTVQGPGNSEDIVAGNQQDTMNLELTVTVNQQDAMDTDRPTSNQQGPQDAVPEQVQYLRSSPSQSSSWPQHDDHTSRSLEDSLQNSNHSSLQISNISQSWVQTHHGGRRPQIPELTLEMSRKRLFSERANSRLTIKTIGTPIQERESYEMYVL